VTALRLAGGRVRRRRWHPLVAPALGSPGRRADGRHRAPRPHTSRGPMRCPSAFAAEATSRIGTARNLRRNAGWRAVLRPR